jgi:hypothetical protein
MIQWGESLWVTPLTVDAIGLQMVARVTARKHRGISSRATRCQMCHSLRYRRQDPMAQHIAPGPDLVHVLVTFWKPREQKGDTPLSAPSATLTTRR